MPSTEWEFTTLLIAPEPDSVRPITEGPHVKIEPSVDGIEKQILMRREARERKDFAEADKIRDELASKGIILEDRPDGTTRWKR